MRSTPRPPQRQRRARPSRSPSTSPDQATADGTSQVDGNFSFTGNTGWLYIGSPLHVAGNFSVGDNGPYANPAVQFNHDGMTVSGHSSIS
jgi:hypothetical protein